MRFERISSPRAHPLLLRAVAEALHRIFTEGAYADKIIEQTLRLNPKAGSRDRAFIAETTYEVVRYYRLYSEMLGRTPRLLADWWEVVGLHLVRQELRRDGSDEDILQNVVRPIAEFSRLDPAAIRLKLNELQAVRRYRESMPDWLDELAAAELPDQWDTTADWLNRQAAVVLRTNLLKTTRSALQDALKQEGIDTEPIGNDAALQLVQRRNVFQTAAFRGGLFEVQDYSSQLVAPLLDPQPGHRVVDACAGAGGKSLHLAALMQNRGSLIALDTLAWKLDELRTRARRAGATNIDGRTIENNKVIKRLHGSADRLLLDVPCSGLGVLRRNPDTKWKMTLGTLDGLRATQQEILQSYSPILKPGGQMVYATCSILPSENRQQVDHFLASPAGQNFELISDRSILPQDEGFDGFYMALMRSKG
jgi:16S rRNA (cytosine967-C5)-methyltransferase